MGKSKKFFYMAFDYLNKYMRSKYNTYNDFTNVYMNTLFGGLGSPDKFSTILIRIEKERDILANAIKGNIIKCPNMNITTKEKMKNMLIQYSMSKVKSKENNLKC